MRIQLLSFLSFWRSISLFIYLIMDEQSVNYAFIVIFDSFKIQKSNSFEFLSLFKWYHQITCKIVYKHTYTILILILFHPNIVIPIDLTHNPHSLFLISLILLYFASSHFTQILSIPSPLPSPPFSQLANLLSLSTLSPFLFFPYSTPTPRSTPISFYLLLSTLRVITPFLS